MLWSLNKTFTVKQPNKDIEEIKCSDNSIENWDYPQIIAGIGVIGGIYVSIKNKHSFGQTAFYAIMFGLAGAFIGTTYNKFKNK